MPLLVGRWTLSSHSSRPISRTKAARPTRTASRTAARGAVMSGGQAFDDRLDMQARHVDGGKSRRLLVEHDGKIGAGEPHCLHAVAPLEVGGNAAQARGILRIGLLGVEDPLVGLADEVDFVGPRLD